jgi:hypothetical protein
MLTVRALFFCAIASLLAGCGGGTATPPPVPTGDSHLTATPASIQVNNLSGAPLPETVTIGGSANIPLNTSTFFIEVAGAPQAAPFEPSLHAHFVVNDRTTIDPEATLAPATPPPAIPVDLATAPPGDSVGFESGAMPQLLPGVTYTLYVYSDACQVPWKAGSFST